MKTALDCIHCFLRQALEAARFVTGDPRFHERVVREVIGTLGSLDFSRSPVVAAQIIHRRLRELTGQADPYRAAKVRFNRLALELLPALETEVRISADPMEMVVRLAIAGNLIDLGAGALDEDGVRRAIQVALSEPFVGSVAEFRDAVSRAERILYLADNAGEIVFDRLLIERLPAGCVTVAVRGGPVINDATVSDAYVAGLPGIAEVIDNGSDAPGTVLDDCSPAFRSIFEKADVVIAKGQGNFETLNDKPADVFFLFKVKCPVIASEVGLDVGTHVLKRSDWATVATGGDDHARI